MLERTRTATDVEITPSAFELFGSIFFNGKCKFVRNDVGTKIGGLAKFSDSVRDDRLLI